MIEVILFAQNAEAPIDTALEKLVQRARQNVYNDTGQNSTFSGFSLADMEPNQIESLRTAYNINRLPAVVVQEDGEIKRRIESNRINYQNLYNAINYRNLGSGKDVIPADGGSDGVIPLLGIENIQNLLSETLKRILTDRKLQLALLAALFIILNNRNKR